MAMRDMKILGLALFAVLAVSLAPSGSAQSNSGCTQVLMTLSPCLNYVTGNSSTPSSTCCSTLGSIVQSQPRCLCLLLNGTVSSPGYNINRTLALELPGACNVNTPSASLCNASPSSAPTTSPPADDDVPVAPATSSSGSKTTPTTTTTTSGSKSIGASLGTLLFALILASFGSNLFKF